MSLIVPSVSHHFAVIPVLIVGSSFVVARIGLHLVRLQRSCNQWLLISQMWRGTDCLGSGLVSQLVFVYFSRLTFEFLFMTILCSSFTKSTPILAGFDGVGR